MLAPVFTMQCSPTRVPALTIAPGMTTVPAPISASGEITALGCTAVAKRTFPRARRNSTTRRRASFFPMLTIAVPAGASAPRTTGSPQNSRSSAESSHTQSIATFRARRMSRITLACPPAP